jgi:hypothetical protein
MTFHHSFFKFFHSLSPIPWHSFLLRIRKTLARMHAIVPLSPSSPSSSTQALRALKKDIHPHGSDMSIHIMSDSSIFSTPPLFRCYVIYHIQKVPSVFQSLFANLRVSKLFSGCDPQHHPQKDKRIANRWETNSSKAPQLIIMIGQSETGSNGSRWETNSSKASGLIIMIGQSETGSKQLLIFITLFFFLTRVRLCCAFYRPQPNVKPN